jgi:hypothetical protein
MNLLRRTAAVAVGAAVFTLASGLASTAWADTVTRERSVWVAWIQQGAIPGVQGNVHMARFEAYGNAGEHSPRYVYGEMLDFTCPDGYLPVGFGEAAILQLQDNCVHEDSLVMETADLVLTIDGRLHSARMVGTINYIHTVAPGADGSFSVDLRWSAPGEKTVTRVVDHPNGFVDATTTREASVTGTFGTEHIGTGTQVSEGQTMRWKHTVRG